MKIEKSFFIKLYETLQKYNALLNKLEDLGIGTEDLAWVETDIWDALELSEGYCWSDEIFELLYINEESKSAEEIYTAIEAYQKSILNKKVDK